MTVPVLLALAAALAAAPPAVPAWLVGTWIWAEEGAQPDFGECEGPLAITYEPDGAFRLTGEAGTWRLEANRLFETATSTDPAVWGNAAPPAGVPHRSRVERIDANSFRKAYATGTRLRFYRCPPE